jgi:hypothetical protein
MNDFHREDKSSAGRALYSSGSSSSMEKNSTTKLKRSAKMKRFKKTCAMSGSIHSPYPKSSRPARPESRAKGLPGS